MTLPSVDELAAGVRARSRALLARAITLIESTHPAHRLQARALLQALLPETGAAQRVAITGPPGAGKSVLIERLGLLLTGRGRRVAVLAIDPTSSISGGSVLGDKTRMNDLARDPNAFVRPSPSAGTLGGVTRATHETALVCEAAGYEVILIETVGVGQSETVAADLVDFFCVLALPGAGDELQGIKRGVLELADLIAVNKADGDAVERAKHAAGECRHALRAMRPASPTWQPSVILTSGLTGDGVDELWTQVEAHCAALTATGERAARRREQRVRWLWRTVDDRLREALRGHPAVASLLPELEDEVAGARLVPGAAADQVLAAFGLDGAPADP